MTTDLTAPNQVEALAAMPRDLAIMRMENDSIMSLAAARPRDYEVIKKDLATQLAAFPVLATEAIYNKPVGRGEDICQDCGSNNFPDKKTRKTVSQCWKCKSPKVKPGEMKYAQGLSVRAAETLAECCGFNSIRCDVTPLDDTTVKVNASYTDYQRGRTWHDGGIVSKMQKRKDGSMELINEDRFYNVVLKAEKSKYLREVIVRSLPAGLKAWFWEQCEKISEGLLDDKTVERIVGQFSAKNVTPEMLEELLGVTRAQGWNKAHRQTLLGLWNAIKDGETTVAEAFGLESGSPSKQPENTTESAGQVTGSDLTGGKASATDRPMPKTEPIEEAKKMAALPAIDNGEDRDSFFAGVQAQLDSISSMGKFLELNKKVEEMLRDDGEVLRYEGMSKTAKERIRGKK
jgi:hypothetical protein